MSAIHLLTVAAMVVLAALCAVAGYRLGTHRLAVLGTALAAAARAADLPDRSQLWTGEHIATREPVYGLIEWDSARTPMVIVGCCHDAVRRRAVEIFRTMGEANFASDSPDFLTEHPFPGPQAPEEVISEWLEELSEATTSPWFTLLDSKHVVRTPAIGCC